MKGGREPDCLAHRGARFVQAMMTNGLSALDLNWSVPLAPAVPLTFDHAYFQDAGGRSITRMPRQRLELAPVILGVVDCQIGLMSARGTRRR